MFAKPVAFYCAQLHFASLECATSILCILSAFFFYAWLLVG